MMALTPQLMADLPSKDHSSTSRHPSNEQRIRHQDAATPHAARPDGALFVLRHRTATALDVHGVRPPDERSATYGGARGFIKSAGQDGLFVTRRRDRRAS
jgi:hypothetical protein